MVQEEEDVEGFVGLRSAATFDIAGVRPAWPLWKSPLRQFESSLSVL